MDKKIICPGFVITCAIFFISNLHGQAEIKFKNFTLRPFGKNTNLTLFAQKALLFKKEKKFFLEKPILKHPIFEIKSNQATANLKNDEVVMLGNIETKIRLIKPRDKQQPHKSAQPVF